MIFRARQFQFDLSQRVLVMGVVNVTPDSFSDGGKYENPASALGRALELIEEGADILDIGAVSTRPGAVEVSVEEEGRRLFPVLEKILKAVKVPVSIDTTSAEISREALQMGAHIINDVSGLQREPNVAGEVARLDAGLIVMHRRGTAQTMQHFAQYQDVVSEVKAELLESLNIARRSGIDDSSIVVDPGIGFSKTAAQNLEILNRLSEFSDLRLPVMVGISRKSFIGHTLHREITERKIGSIAGCVLAVREGARLVRVHDVGETRDAVDMTLAILKHGNQQQQGD
ncbi:MAG: dihydropteroate synthase [Candidatus Omnitrophica bacterium]|nr:dihydropteroate synthase [Candidatus Omnitrophota bacterium]